MTAGWTEETMARFEDALARLAASNGKALKLSLLLSADTTLEEKQWTVEAWRSLAASIVSDGRVTAAPKDLPNWYGLAALFEEWTRREDPPALNPSQGPGK
jgi:hypothetical protein